MIGWIVLGIVVILIIAIIGWVITTYNKLVKARLRVKNSWSQIDVQLKRRFDLIPNLVETTKGYAKHENDILGAFARARDIYNQASKEGSVKGISEADKMLSSTLSRLIAVSEAYPELKANEQFNTVMKELSSTEDKIAYARQFYNDVVMTYNTMREVFPGSIIANMFGFQAAESFEADAESRENVKVQF
jgi:LemA protein